MDRGSWFRRNDGVKELAVNDLFRVSLDFPDRKSKPARRRPVIRPKISISEGDRYGATTPPMCVDSGRRRTYNLLAG